MKEVEQFNNAETQALNTPVLIGSNALKLKKDWNTPYNFFKKGETKTLSQFAQLLATTTNDFSEQFKKGMLDDWFEMA